MTTKSLIAIIPVYNEAKYIEKTINGLLSIQTIIHIIIINDGSTDKTGIIIDKEYNNNNKIIIKHHYKKLGKGKALSTGLSIVKEKNYFYDIMFLDGDLSDSVTGCISMIEYAQDTKNNNKWDMIIGILPKREKFTNKKGGFNIITNFSQYGIKYITNKTIQNPLSGQRIIKNKIINIITPLSIGYGCEVGMIIDILKHNHKIIEIPINCNHRYSFRRYKDWIHKFRQLNDIIITLINKFYKYKSSTKNSI